MGAIKEFYHDLIEQESRNADDYDYQYKEWCDKQQEIERQEYFEKQFNKKLTIWQKLLIQLRAWRSQSYSIITSFFRTKNLF